MSSGLILMMMMMKKTMFRVIMMTTMFLRHNPIRIPTLRRPMYIKKIEGEAQFFVIYRVYIQDYDKLYYKYKTS